MGGERAGWAGMSPHVASRLMVTITLFIGSVCIVGGYMLARMSQNDMSKGKHIVTINLTINAENLYKKAKRLSPKAVHHNDPEKVIGTLLGIFQCSHNDYGQILYISTLMTQCVQEGEYVAEFIKHSIKYQVIKLMGSIHNASVYLDSLK